MTTPTLQLRMRKDDSAIQASSAQYCHNSWKACGSSYLFPAGIFWPEQAEKPSDFQESTAYSNLRTPRNVSVDANRLFFRSLLGKNASPKLTQPCTAFGFLAVICQKGYLMMPGVFAPTPNSKTERELPHGEEGNPHSALRPHTSPHPAQSIINPQIHRHRSPANRAPGDQLCGDLHVFVGQSFPGQIPHCHTSFLTAGFGALPQAIVPLGVKQAALIKPGNLELMVHIGGQDKIVFAVYQSQQIAVWFSSSGLITVD